MEVVKRDGRREPVQFDKITSRLAKLRAPCGTDGRQLDVDVTRVAAQVCASVRDGITTSRLDELAADIAAAMSTDHPDYCDLAARVLVSNLQKNTSDAVSETFERMADVLNAEFLASVRRNADALQAMVDYDRDFNFDFFGFKTLEKMYLTRVDGVIVERPQHMWLRVAVALWADDLDRVRDTYDRLSTGQFTHASPTLFNAGTKKQQLSSCFLAGVEADSVEGIFDAITRCAHISKFGGGIGLHVSGVRSKGARIRGTNGYSDGLVPMLRVVNSVATYINQGARRKGSIAIYIEPHHPDILDVLALKRNNGDEHLRARDLFYAVWVSDLFMQRVRDNGTWSLFDPDVCPGLADVWGDEYAALYERYEVEGLATRTMPAQDLWFEILRSQIETGTPYILFKDAVNAKSNQQNLGTIKTSNLCVSGDTRILTSTGYHPIADLVGQTVRVWNGEEWSETVVKKTGTSQKLVTVTLDNGTELRCTPYHKFYVETSPRLVPCSRVITVPASDLQPGDRLVKFDLPPPVAASTLRHERQPYTFDKSDVPINSSTSDKLRWLEGYVDGDDGTVVHNDGIENLQVANVSKEFLHDVQLMLQTLGVSSTVTRAEGMADLPDGLKTYDTKALWRISVGSSGVLALVAMGFSPSRVRVTGGREAHTYRYTRVVSVIDNGDVEDTYCFNEPLRHAGVFEGVLTGQCSEIVEYTSPDEVAVCTLGSLCLPRFVRDGEFDFQALLEATRVLARNLDKVIDINYYPIPEARTSNERHRPVGIGVQGLQDVFFMLRLPFDSPEAARLNLQIFETIYFGALMESCILAKEHGAYSTFRGSPASLGRLQFDLWGQPTTMEYPWEALKTDIRRWGLRNSLSIAPMPTASTASIYGNTESTEPVTSNLYSRRTLAGEFVVVNKHLVRDLLERGLWTAELKNAIVANDGSIQGLDVPDEIKALYKTAWDLSMKTVIDMAADRGRFVCQTQSMNLFVAEPNYKKLSSMHFYSWTKGLKTGCYYLRTKPAARAVQVTVEPCVACSA